MSQDHAYQPSYGAVPPMDAALPPQTSNSYGAPGFYRGTPLASWAYRVGANLIDYLPLGIVVNSLGGVGLWLYVLVTIANCVVMQGLTGQSLGKRILGLKLGREVLVAHPGMPHSERDAYFVYPGIAVCALRQFAHALDFFTFCIGYLRPLWHQERQTFADSICHTYVTAPNANIDLVTQP
jgi:hypothetical protein